MTPDQIHRLRQKAGRYRDRIEEDQAAGETDQAIAHAAVSLALYELLLIVTDTPDPAPASTPLRAVE